MKNVALMIGCVGLFGVSALLRKLSVDRIHPYQLQVIAGLVYAIELPIWLWLIDRDNNIGGYNISGIGLGIACIVVHVLAAVMFGMLLRSSSSPGAVSTIVATYPVITAFLSWMMLGEEYTAKKIIATIITIIGVMMFSL